MTSAYTSIHGRSGTVEGPLTLEADIETVTLCVEDGIKNLVCFTIDMADVPAVIEHAAHALRLSIVPAVSA